MDAGPAWIAYKKGLAEIVAAEVHDGETYYTAALFTKKDSMLKDIQDIKGKRIAFTSITGSSGFIVPVGRMIENGMIIPKYDNLVGVEEALKETFEQYIFAGGYGQALDLVAKWKVDVAAGSLRFFETKAKPEIREEVKVMIKMGRVPTHVLVVSNELPEHLKVKITQVFLDLSVGENANIINQIYGIDGLILTNAEDHLSEFGSAIDSISGIAKKKWGIS